MKTLYTSDPHLGHHTMAQTRGFSSTQEHDAAIMDGLYEDTSPGDEVWFLGDLSIGSRTATDYALGLLGKFSDSGRRLHLISGNHDMTSPIHRNGHSHQADFFRVFESVSHVARRKVGEGWVWLSHFPFYGHSSRSEKARHRMDTAIRVHDDGRTALLHGHLHLSEPVSGPRSVDVGLDAHGLRAWQQEELAALLATLPGVLPDQQDEVDVRQ